MIVLDASIVVSLLIQEPVADVLRRDLSKRDDTFAAPHLLDLEVTSALRKLVAGKRLAMPRVQPLLQELVDLPAARYPHAGLIPRIWELRHNFTAYDAAYVALAEFTGAVLYTCDEKLSQGHRARVRLFVAA